MNEMAVREHDIDHEQGAQNRVNGPDWKWIVGIGGTIIVLLIGFISSMSSAQLIEIKTRQQQNIDRIQQNTNDITRLQSDMSYIKQAVDEIRLMIRSGL